jgi:hypothetical protein
MRETVANHMRYSPDSSPSYHPMRLVLWSILGLGCATNQSYQLSPFTPPTSIVSPEHSTPPTLRRGTCPEEPNPLPPVRNSCDWDQETEIPGIFHALLSYHGGIYNLEVIQCQNNRTHRLRRVATWLIFCSTPQGEEVTQRIPIPVQNTIVDLLPQVSISTNTENESTNRLCFTLTPEDRVSFTDGSNHFNYAQIATTPPDGISIPASRNGSRRFCLQLPVENLTGNTTTLSVQKR